MEGGIVKDTNTFVQFFYYLFLVFFVVVFLFKFLLI